MHPLTTLTIFFAMIFTTCLNASAQTDKQKFASLIEQDWQLRLQQTSYAASVGEPFDASKNDNVSLVFLKRQHKESVSIQKALGKIDTEALGFNEKINLRLLQMQVAQRIKSFEYGEYQIPFNSDSGFYSAIMHHIRNLPFSNQKDYENYLSYLEGIDSYFLQHTHNMRAGINRMFTQPKIVEPRVVNTLDNIINTSVEDSPFWSPFKKWPKNITLKQQRDLQERARNIIGVELKNAYRELMAFFTQEYFPKAKASIAAGDLPKGKQYYYYLTKKFTTLDTSPEAVHQIGLSEVARIKNQMLEIIKQTGFEGDFSAFLEFLRTDSRFYAKSAEALLKEAAYLAKTMDGKLPQLFSRLPRQPYTVEPVPAAIAPSYTTGRYVRANPDSTRPGLYWVNTYALDKRPLYELEALTYHEAVPGHHLQIALAAEMSNLPKFRKYAYLSAFGEGWALYSEELGKEVGLYQDPYSDFGRLTFEMWRAVRLVVDTGMHVKGWTRERSVAFMADNTALSLHNVNTEIDRYISWPGQALSYKIGQLKIKALRNFAETELGERFDVRVFHDVVLADGAIPLPILEENVKRFVDRVKSGKLPRIN